MAERAGQRTRERIIDSGLSLLSEQGLENVSLRQVATTAGITPMAIYRHFDDKQSLQFALLERAFVLFEQYLRDRRTAQSARNDLLELARRFFDFALERESHFVFLFLSDARPASAGWDSPVRAISSPTFLLLREAIKAWSEEEAVTIDDLNLLTTDVLAFCIGHVALLISGNLFYAEKSKRKALNAAFERYLATIENNPSSTRRPRSKR